MSIKSLIINPGSTSTKIAVFEDENMLFDQTLRHSNEELAPFNHIIEQMDFRKNIILDFLKEKNFDLNTLNVCVGRGGLVKPIPGGTYTVNEALAEALKTGVQGEHASNLGGLLAREIGDPLGIPSYIVDPVVVDEMQEVARISGCPEIPRTAIGHPLNQKAMGRKFAKENGKKYEDLNLVIVHMGGGVSCAAHDHGKMIDIFNALDGDGAFSPERAGGVPVGGLIKLCFSGKYSEAQVRKMFVGEGGLNAYLHNNSMMDCRKNMEAGDQKAKLIIDAFIYQVSKNIGSMATVLKGKVDQIILTGGIAYEKYVTEGITERVGFIAPVTVYKGEDELLALAQGGLRVLNGEEEAKIYE